jgi:hypothetical protein
MTSPSQTQPLFAERTSDEIDDDDYSILLSPDQLQRVAQFREEIGLCQTDLDRYQACVRIRDEILGEDARVRLLAAACEHVMSSECSEYQKRKQRSGNLSNGPARRDEDDTRYWHQFFGIAEHGLDIKSQCVAALKTVARYWGQNRVQHYCTNGRSKGRNTATCFVRLRERFPTGIRLQEGSIYICLSDRRKE